MAAAYSLSRLRPVLGNVIFALMLATLMIPATVLVVPQYVTIANLPLLHLNLMGSPEAIWLPSVANAFNIFLLKRFFDSISGDLLSAAAIDGASPLRTLRSVVLPILPADHRRRLDLSLVAVWKDFLWPLLVEYGYNPNRETLNVGRLRGRQHHTAEPGARRLSDGRGAHARVFPHLPAQHPVRPDRGQPQGLSPAMIEEP